MGRSERRSKGGGTSGADDAGGPGREDGAAVASRLPRPRTDPDDNRTRAKAVKSAKPARSAAADPKPEKASQATKASKPEKPGKPEKSEPEKPKKSETSARAEPAKSETRSQSAKPADSTTSAAAAKRGGPAPVPARTAGDVLVDHLAAEAAEFLRQAPRVREGGDDSAHQMRVAARRMRSALRTCAPLVAPESAEALSVELRWAADCLAGERDNEVLLERLLTALDGLPVRSGTPRARAAVERRLRTGLTTGHTTALRALGSADFVALAARLAEPRLGLELTAKATGPAAEVVPALVDKTFGRLAKGANGLPLAEAGVAYAHPVPFSGEDDPAWHRVRILGKRARYAADMCVPEFGAPAKDLAKRMKAVTESLGTHQDAALAAEVARDLALSPRIGGAAAFVLGELYTVQRFAVAEARFTFAALWPTLRDRLREVGQWSA